MFSGFIKRLAPQKSEDLCLRCGRCCHGKVEVEGQVYYTPEMCPYLDEDSRLCRVYDIRFEICSDCITIADAIEIGALPEDCPYVAEIPDYRGPKSFEDLKAEYGDDVLDNLEEERNARPD